MPITDSFPLRGVIGVIADNASELDQAISNQLSCVEIRADLLLDKGLTLDSVMDIVRHSHSLRLGSLVTLRHPTHGGKFAGSEQDRVDINRLALDAGADIIDLEWDTPAARQMLSSGAPMILSYHNFNGMLNAQELAELTSGMSASEPTAIKVVPTASTLADATRMLQWVEQGDGESIMRIGFAMGSIGACSRILTTAFGGAVTYASFAEAVAPGQIALEEMLNTYRIMELDHRTQVVAVAGSELFRMQKVTNLNKQFEANGESDVAIGFATADAQLLKELRMVLRVKDIVVETE